jgi:protein-S-isoprenylcysteine O-methyltransferase Ste14
MKIRLSRGPLRWWLIVIGLLLARPVLGAALAGAALVLLGSLIHLWAKGCLQQNRQLTVCGPYRWSRNPFYLANFCIDLGLCLFINNTWFTFIFMILWAIVYRRQILSEERTLHGIYGQAWLDYRKAVPAFLPYRRPYREVPAEQGFCWANPNLSTSRELPRLVRTASYPLVLLVAGEVGPTMWIHLHKAGLPWIQCFAWLAGAAGMACVAGIVALQSFAAILKRQLHGRRPILPGPLRSPYLQIALVAAYLAALVLIDKGLVYPHPLLLPLGLALLAFGFYCVQRRRKHPGLRWDACAWAGALGGAAVLSGMFWLGILAVALALAICADSHIAPTWSLAFPAFDGSSPAPQGVRFWGRPRLSSHYLLFALLTLAISLGKAATSRTGTSLVLPPVKDQPRGTSHAG